MKRGKKRKGEEEGARMERRRGAEDHVFLTFLDGQRASIRRIKIAGQLGSDNLVIIMVKFCS